MTDQGRGVVAPAPVLSHAMPDRPDSDGPCGELALRTVAMPADTNPAGDIFGGWIMGLMDLAAGASASAIARGRVVTKAVSDLTFLRPVKVGDAVTCYTEVLRLGRSSITMSVDVWALRARHSLLERVTQARFVFVAVDHEGNPRAIDAPAG